MQLNIGSVYPGKVTGTTKFGVFVELESGITGLVHISEVSASFVQDINDYVKVGDEVKVKVLSLDGSKIALSMKRAAEDGRQKPQPRARTPVFDGIPQKDTANMSFEDMMARFKASSDEKFTDLKRKNGDVRRSRRAHSEK